MNDIKVILALIVSLLFTPIHAQSVVTHFNQIKNDPLALYVFFSQMPKGGELHYHLAGGPYPEVLLKIAEQGTYCFDKDNLAIVPDATDCKATALSQTFSDANLYAKTINSWSMKNFIPSTESSHDHFFQGFAKYMPLVTDYKPQLIAYVMKLAALQKENYLELMDISDNAKALAFGPLLAGAKSNEEKRNILLKDKNFQENIKDTVLNSDNLLKQARQELGCSQSKAPKACEVQITFIYYLLREQPLDNFFAQALNAFEAVSQSSGTLVGINIVQAEDSPLAVKDYRKHMQIINYLHRLYPKVHISLHAGELTPELVAPEDLGYHIYDALLVGHAERIGHGVDIAYETKAEETLAYMAAHHIPVEINLTSNYKILGIFGAKHPLNYYLAHQVPVVLSTDDAGVLRTNINHEYVKAVIEHHLDYPTLKQINRNTLTYSFLPGQSIWANAQTGQLVPECQDLDSAGCKALIMQSKKGALQWKLEQELMAFEHGFE